MFAKNEMGNRLTAINNRICSRTLPLSINQIYFFDKILIWNCKSSKTSYRVKKNIFFQSEFSFFLNIFSIFFVLIVKHYNIYTNVSCENHYFYSFLIEFTNTYYWPANQPISTYICAILVKLFIAKISCKNISVTFLRPQWCAAKPSLKLLI